jgi:C-methyltransferase C-terminal domain/Putative zinc binding domain/Methyltransferase domain
MTEREMTEPEPTSDEQRATDGHACRACRGRDGQVVLDLGDQPAADHFPERDDPGPDPVHPLQMWLCAACGLAQLLTDPTVPEEPRGAEPAALVQQAADAVARVGEAGWLPPGANVAEYGSPHGGSWSGLLAPRGLHSAGDAGPADVVLDCFGLMHAADQSAALRERADRVAPGGVLLLQYHSLATIVRLGQWNSLRHGHYAYYSTTALARMLSAVGFSASTAWSFDLYGGTVLLAATRDADGLPEPDRSVRALLADEASLRVDDPARLRRLQHAAVSHAAAVRGWLEAQRGEGRTVLGYGAASRAVALLCRSGVDSGSLPAIADASPAKQGRRMPATDIPVIAPGDLVSARPDAVLLFLPDLMAEVRARLPEIESSGGRWVDVDDLASDTTS